MARIKEQFIVRCKTSKEWDKLIKVIEKVFPDMIWKGGEILGELNDWNEDSNKTCISCLENNDYELTYGPVDIFKTDYSRIKIISLKEFIKKYDKKKTIVFCQGSFDLFHYGHIKFLQKAKAQGDYLIVGVNTDRLYRKYKEKEPVIPYTYRVRMIAAMKCVDEAVPANGFSPRALLDKYNVDVYIICKEWLKTKEKDIAYMENVRKGKVVVFPYFKTISASDIRSKITKNYLDHSKHLCEECHKRL